MMVDKRLFFVFILLFLVVQVVDGQDANILEQDGYNHFRTQDGGYVINNLNFEREYDSFKLDGNEFSLRNGAQMYFQKGGRITLNRVLVEEGEYIFKMFKDRNTVGSVNGDLKVGQTEFNGVSDINVILNKDKEIVFAEFVSVEGGEYVINHKSGTYTFNVEAGGKVVFNPRERLIEGDENTKFVLKNDNFEVLQFEKFTAHLDENGNVDFIEIDKNGRFSNSDVEYSSKSDKFRVYFNDPEGGIKNVDGDAILLGKEKDTFKGRIKMTAPGHIGYEGLGEDSLATFDRDFDRFNIIEGDVVMKNEVQEVSVIGGRVKIKRGNINKPGGVAFDFEFVGRGGDKFLGRINGGEYTLVGYDENGDSVIIGKKTLPRLPGQVESGSRFTVERELKSEEELLSDLSAVDIEIDKLNNQIKSLASSEEIDLLNSRIVELRAERSQVNHDLGDLAGRSLSDISEPVTYRVPFIKTILNPKNEFDESQRAIHVDFRIDPVTKEIIGYSYSGQDYEIGNEHEIPFSEFEITDTRSNRYDLINELVKNGADYDTLDRYVEGIGKNLELRDSSKENAFIDAPAAFQETRKYYERAIEDARAIDNAKLVHELELKNAITHMSVRHYDDAIMEFQAFGKEYPLEIRSAASLLSAQSHLLQGERDSEVKALRAVERSYELDPENSATRAFNIEFNENQLEAYKSLIFSELRQTNADARNYHGSSGKVWQATKDSLSIAFAPATNTFNAIVGNDVALQIQNENFALADVRFYAIDQAQLLNDKGVDFKEYLQSDTKSQFAHIYEANGYDSIIPLNELENYGVNLDENSLDDVINAVSRNVNEDIANEFKDAVYDSIAHNINLKDSIRNDPTLYYLFTRGQEVDDFRYSNDDLSNAFNQIRIGNDLERDFGTTATLNVADALANPFVIVKAVSASKGLAQGLISSARILGSEGAIDLGATAVAEVNPILGIATGIAGGKVGDKFLKKTHLVNEVGGTHLSVDLGSGKNERYLGEVYYVDAGEDVADFERHLLISGARAVKNDRGKNLFLLEGKMFELGSGEIPYRTARLVSDSNPEVIVHGTSSGALIGIKEKGGIVKGADVDKQFSGIGAELSQERKEGISVFALNSKLDDSDDLIIQRDLNSYSSDPNRQGDNILGGGKYSDEEIDLIRDRFQIKVAFKDPQFIRNADGSIKLGTHNPERLVENTDSKDLVYFVPKDRVDQVQKYLGRDVDVRAFEDWNGLKKYMIEDAGIGVRKINEAANQVDELGRALSGQQAQSLSEVSEVARLRQQAVASGYRRVDLDTDQVARIESGRFGNDALNPRVEISERDRIDKAIMLLDDQGFKTEADLLRRDVEVQKDLLFAHYTGGLGGDFDFNPVAKFRQLSRDGFSQDSLKMLAHSDNRVLGAGFHFDRPLYTGETHVVKGGSVQEELKNAFGKMNPEGINHITVPDNQYDEYISYMNLNYGQNKIRDSSNGYEFENMEIHIRPKSIVDESDRLGVPVFDKEIIVSEEDIIKIGGDPYSTHLEGGILTASLREGVTIVEIDRRIDGRSQIKHYTRKTIDLENTRREEKLPEDMPLGDIARLHLNKVDLARKIDPKYNIAGFNVVGDQLDIYQDVFNNNEQHTSSRWHWGEWNEAAHWTTNSKFTYGIQFAKPELKAKMASRLKALNEAARESHGLRDMHHGNVLWHVTFKDKTVNIKGKEELVAVPEQIEMRLIDFVDVDRFVVNPLHQTKWIEENSYLWE